MNKLNYIKRKVLQRIADIFNIQIEIIRPKSELPELVTFIMTQDLKYSIYNLYIHNESNKEVELQREFGKFLHLLGESFKAASEYSDYRHEVLQSDNKKLKLIEGLKGIELGKADCIYHSYWESLLMILVSCDVIDKKLAYEISDKIGDIMVGKRMNRND